MSSSTKAGHGIEVGTIYVSMWGYDQTNVDYYEVTRATATTVTLVKIGKRRTDGSAYMVDEVEPKPGDHQGEVTGHTRNDAGEVRGIVVTFPDGEMPYGLATRGEYWRVLPEQGEPEAWR